MAHSYFRGKRAPNFCGGDPIVSIQQSRKAFWTSLLQQISLFLWGTLHDESTIERKFNVCLAQAHDEQHFIENYALHLFADLLQELNREDDVQLKGSMLRIATCLVHKVLDRVRRWTTVSKRYFPQQGDMETKIINMLPGIKLFGEILELPEGQRTLVEDNSVTNDPYLVSRPELVVPGKESSETLQIRGEKIGS